jgi:hypothetical protein
VIELVKFAMKPYNYSFEIGTGIILNICEVGQAITGKHSCPDAVVKID